MLAWQPAKPCDCHLRMLRSRRSKDRMSENSEVWKENYPDWIFQFQKLNNQKRSKSKPSRAEALLLELRNLLFSGCPALGEALDTLEDFARPPEEIKAAAQTVKDMLLSCLAGKGRIIRGWYEDDIWYLTRSRLHFDIHCFLVKASNQIWIKSPLRLCIMPG